MDTDMKGVLRQLNRRCAACEALLIGIFRADREGMPLVNAVEWAISELEASDMPSEAKRDAAEIARDILYKGTISPKA